MAEQATKTGYDFIVVGAGTAGCVLAVRLSENSAARMLVLEAGSSQPLPEMAVPQAWPALMGSSADWADQTVPQSTGAPRLSGCRVRRRRVSRTGSSPRGRRSPARPAWGGPLAWKQWQTIDVEERRRGVETDRPRVKLVDIAAMLAAQ